MIVALVRGALLVLVLNGMGTIAQAQGLEIYKLENELIGWSAEGLRNAAGASVAFGGDFTALDNGGFLQARSQSSYLYDANGKVIGGPYAYLEPVDADLDVLLVGGRGNPTLHDNGGLLALDGSVIAPPHYANLDYLGHGLFRFERARRFGVIDASGREIIAPSYDEITAVGSVLVIRDQGGAALFDLHGEPLSDFSSDTHYAGIDNGYLRKCHAPTGAAADAPLECGLLDPSGQPVFDRAFTDIKYLKDMQRWLVRRTEADSPGTGYGMSVEHYTLLSPDFERLARFSASSVRPRGGRLVIGQVVDGDISYGLIGADGQWLIEPRYQYIRPVSVAYEESDAAKAAPAEFDVQLHSDQGGLHGIVDAAGREILPPRYGDFLTRYPSLELYTVRDGDELGVLDRQGRWRIASAPQDEARNSHLPLPYLILRRDGPDGDWNESQYVLYDLSTGEPVIGNGPYGYLTVGFDHRWKTLGLDWHDFAVVTAQHDGKTGIVNLQGEILVPFEYDGIQALDTSGQMRARQGETDHQINVFSPAMHNRYDDALARTLRTTHAPIAVPSTPYAGRYVPLKYSSESQVAAAFARDELSQPYAPVLLLDGHTAITHWNMIVDSRRPNFQFNSGYCAGDDGFSIALPGSFCEEPEAETITFQQSPGGALECARCGDHGLPTHWIRTNPKPNAQLP